MIRILKIVRHLCLALSICVLAIASTAISQTLPQYFAGTGHWYQYLEYSPTLCWTASRDTAVARGGYLATVLSAEENTFVASLPAAHTAWLGGLELNNDGVWQWVTGEPWSFTSWASGEPSNAGGIENYLAIGGISGPLDWNDAADCNPPWGLIVEYDSDPLACRFGNSLKFDGIDDYVEVPLASLNDLSQGTVEVWVKLDSLETTGPVDGMNFLISRSKSTPSLIGDLRLAVEKNPALSSHRFVFSLNGGTISLKSATNATAGSWTHVAASWDGLTWKIYVNGTLEGTLASSLTLPNDPLMHVNLGKILGADPNYVGWLSGELDEVKFSSLALDSSEFCLDAHCTSGPAVNGLWHFDEVDGIVAKDASSNHYDGTIYNSTHQVCVPCGDADGSGGSITVSDAVYLIKYIFAGGSVPQLLSSADANGDCKTNISDVVYLINWIFASGPGPICGCAEVNSQPLLAKATVGHAIIAATSMTNATAAEVTVRFEATTAVRAVQLELNITGDVRNIQVKSNISDLQLFSSEVESGYRVGLIDLTGTAAIPSGKSEIATITYEGDGELSVSSAIVVDNDASEMNVSIANAKVESVLPTEYSLSQNHPNPFNPSTDISFSLPKTGQVKLVVYNILGAEVATLVDEVRSAGVHNVSWNGTNSSGQQVASGIYLYRLTAGDFAATKKMLLLK